MARSLHRFHFTGTLPAEPGAVVTLPPAESHHLGVLRLAPGSPIEIFDSAGSAWSAATEGGDRSEGARVRLVQPLAPASEASADIARLHIAAALLKHRAMDWMIEKLCELGVASLQPLTTARTVVKADDGDAPKDRWERIALSAAKQSGRNTPMEILPPRPVAAWIGEERPAIIKCFAHFTESAPGLGEWLGDRAGMGLPVLAAVGPEGGWTPQEADALAAAGFAAVHLGPLVLRAETAAITVAAACRVML